MKHPNNLFQLKTIPTFIAILMFGLQSFNSSAQSENMLKLKAHKFFSFSHFNQALPLYLTLLKNEPTNFVYNYRAGMCYLNSNIETNKCIEFFESAQKNMKIPNDSTSDFYYYLGHSYQITNQFDKAIKYLAVSKSMLNIKKDSLNIYFINSEIEQCQNGEKIIASPTRAKLFNLGTNVNTIYPDYSPVILPNQSMLIFTSTRKGSTGGKLTEQGEYYEDIYISKNIWNDSLYSDKIESPFYQPNFSGATFSAATNIGKFINTKSHDASISVSPDGKKLFLFRKNAVWQSAIDNGTFGKPSKLDYTVNGKKRYESSLTITADQNTLYFVSDQKGGIGGKDIYRSFKQADGSWGPEENLGPIINTELDEESPYFDANEGILYFSSQGHNSVGGFDVFKTKFDNDVWIAPKNLGYPINSGTDEVFYSINTQQNRGYISTMRDDAIGNYDIYMVRYLKPLKVFFAATYFNGLKPIDAKATAVDSKTNESSQISLNKTSEINYNSTEKYKLIVPHYDSVSISDTFKFETPESYGDFPYYQEINYDIVKNHNGQLIGYKTTVYNGFFDIEKELQKNKNRKPNLKKEDEYAALVKKLKSENDYFQIYSKINYVDTIALAILAEDLAEKALAEGIPVSAIAASEVEKTKKSIEHKNKKSAIVASPSSTSGSTAFKTILFEFSKTTLTKQAKAELENIFTYLKEHNDISMEIIGYTDSKGSAKYNLALSKKRAVQIKNRLVKKGISPKRLKTNGLGEKNPAAPNKNSDNSDNLENRKLNRRVEFVIVTRK